PHDSRNEVEKAQRADAGKWPEPAAPEQSHGHGRNHDHRGVFCEEEQREAEAAVFGVKACDKFGFGFGQIEWRTVGFSNAAYEKKNESQRLQKYVPVVTVALRFHNTDKTEGSRHHEDAHDRETKSYFITDHLRRRTERTQQRILAVRSPAAKNDAQDSDRRNR